MALTVVTPVLYDGESGRTGKLGRIMAVGSVPVDIAHTFPVTGTDFQPFGTDCIIEIASNYILPELFLKFLVKHDIDGDHGAELTVTGRVYDSSKVLLLEKANLYPMGGAYGNRKQTMGLMQLGPQTGAYYVGMSMHFESRLPFTTDTFHVTTGMSRLY
jgi:hypothetical protein